MQGKVLLALFILSAVIGSHATFDWSNHGGNILNTRYANDHQDNNQFLDSSYVSQIVHAWTFEAGSYISATPAVKGDVLYFPAFDGYLYAVYKHTGSLIWKVSIPSISGIPGDYCRSTPTIYGNTIVFGTRSAGRVISLKINDGSLRWSTVVNNHYTATVTMSGTIHANHIYIGVSSNEELYSANPDYECCSFVGSFHKINLQTGNVVWTFKTIHISLPTGPGQYSGVGAWGSSPVIDTVRNAVFFATGNPYDVPASVQACQDLDPLSSTCINAEVYFNGVLSVDLTTGGLNWYKRLSDYDAWNVACIFGGPNCPAESGPDYDFGMAPTLVRNVNGQDILLAAQKSGIAWSLNPDDGDINWGVQAGPGGTLGGAIWGAPTDGEKYYVGVINSEHSRYEMIEPANTVHYGGGWSALNISNGNMVWQVADPAALSSDINVVHGSGGAGPGTLVNDLYIVGSTQAEGHVYIFNKDDGAQLWDFATGGTVYGGAAVSDNCFYIGSGYNPLFNALWTGNTKLFAFCVNNYDQ